MKTLLSLGGASVNATQFRTVFEPDKIRREFIRNTIKYLRKYKFDGLDLDWEFPETENDRRIFSMLVRDYRLEFQNEAFLTDRARLLLTAAVAAYRPKIEAGYDIKEISPFLDYINLMAYDYHGELQPAGWQTEPHLVLNRSQVVGIRTQASTVPSIPERQRKVTNVCSINRPPWTRGSMAGVQHRSSFSVSACTGARSK